MNVLIGFGLLASPLLLILLLLGMERLAKWSTDEPRRIPARWE